MGRNFAQTIESGDSLIGIFPLPEIEGYSTGTPSGTDVYALYLSLLDSNSETMYTGVINTETSDVRWTVDTSGLAAGGYAWRLKATFEREAETRVLTFARGLIEVTKQSDPQDAAVSHCRSMILIFRELIRQKAQGTSDLTAYSIGGRNTSLMSFDEIKTMLSRYENELKALQGGKQFWNDGTRVRTGIDWFIQGMR